MPPGVHNAENTGLTEEILRQIRAFSTGGGYHFEPGPREPHEARNPRDPQSDGVTEDLCLGGARVARSGGGPTYCCGVTFEVWWRAWFAAGGQAPAGLDGEGLRALLSTWFCPSMGHPGVQAALIAHELGHEIDIEAARPGDLIQFWRSVDLAAPSGHSAVFLGWDDEGQGHATLRYWSSQPATGGIGIHSETVGPAWQLFTVRPASPPDSRQ